MNIYMKIEIKSLFLKGRGGEVKDSEFPPPAV